MPSSRRTTAVVGLTLALAPLLTTGCVDRVIRELGLCGDGTLDPGEICLGRGDRSSIPIEGIDGLVMRTADFDGDAHVDLLVLGTDASGVVSSILWRGTGQGTFEPPMDPAIRGCSAYAVAGQGDADEIADVLVDDCGPSMSLFLGTGSGTFSAPETIQTGVETRSSGMVDLDRDGLREVIAMGTNGGSIAMTVIERADDGSSSIRYTALGAMSPEFDPRGLGLLDVDDDQIFDALLVQSGQPGGLTLAAGEPEFGFAAPRPIGPPGLVVDTSLVRDLDEDERPDVLAVNFDDEALIFLRAEDGDLVERARTIVPGLRVGPAGGGDIDADDHFDLLLFEPGSRKLQAWFGRGDGGFEGPFDVDLDAPIGQIALVDLDEDGALDIVAGTFEDGAIQILLSDP